MSEPTEPIEAPVPTAPITEEPKAPTPTPKPEPDPDEEVDLFDEIVQASQSDDLTPYQQRLQGLEETIRAKDELYQKQEQRLAEMAKRLDEVHEYYAKAREAKHERPAPEPIRPRQNSRATQLSFE